MEEPAGPNSTGTTTPALIFEERFKPGSITIAPPTYRASPSITTMTEAETERDKAAKADNFSTVSTGEDPSHRESVRRLQVQVEQGPAAGQLWQSISPRRC